MGDSGSGEGDREEEEEDEEEEAVASGGRRDRAAADEDGEELDDDVDEDDTEVGASEAEEDAAGCEETVSGVGGSGRCLPSGCGSLSLPPSPSYPLLPLAASYVPDGLCTVPCTLNTGGSWLNTEAMTETRSTRPLSTPHWWR